MPCILSKTHSNKNISRENNRYPFCIVWGQLPLITWLCPIVGHLGICDSNGVIHDFSGTYLITIDRFMTGKVLRYFQVDIDKLVYDKTKYKSPEKFWDECIYKADINNCHDHVTMALNNMNIQTKMLPMITKFTLQANYTGKTSLVKTYGPMILMLIILLLVFC